MAKLKTKVQHALDETRMLVLGSQVLIGFDYRAVLESGYDSLSRAAQLMLLASLILLLGTFALLLAPASDHRLSERGQDTPAFHRLTTTFAAMALLPFAAALALDMAIAASKLTGARGVVAAGVVTGAVMLTLWYGVELVGRRLIHVTEQTEMEKTKTSDRIRHVLTEARVVLPGAQALLGFQFASMFVSGFDKLSPAMKWLHFASLSSVAVATALLMLPAAWHRIVERGEETERFHRFASRVLLCALGPLALGMLGDFYLVADKVTHAPALAGALTAALALVFFGLWFVLGFVRRALSSSRPEAAPSPTLA